MRLTARRLKVLYVCTIYINMNGITLNELHEQMQLYILPVNISPGNMFSAYIYVYGMLPCLMKPWPNVSLLHKMKTYVNLGDGNN